MNNKVEKVITDEILPRWLSLTLGTLCLTLAAKGRTTNSISPTSGTSGWDGTLILFSLQPYLLADLQRGVRTSLGFGKSSVFMVCAVVFLGFSLSPF